jgi:hypothetical protein
MQHKLLPAALYAMLKAELKLLGKMATKSSGGLTGFWLAAKWSVLSNCERCALQAAQLSPEARCVVTNGGSVCTAQHCPVQAAALSVHQSVDGHVWLAYKHIVIENHCRTIQLSQQDMQHATTRALICCCCCAVCIALLAGVGLSRKLLCCTRQHLTMTPHPCLHSPTGQQRCSSCGSGKQQQTTAAQHWSSYGAQQVNRHLLVIN